MTCPRLHGWEITEPHPRLLDRETCVQISCSEIPALPLTSCVALPKIFNISVPSVGSSIKQGRFRVSKAVAVVRI